MVTATAVKIGRFNPEMTALPASVRQNTMLGGLAIIERGQGQNRHYDRKMLDCQEYFPGLKPIKYKGPESQDVMAFHYYNPAIKIPSLNMTMGELLPFAEPAWHFDTTGTDMFSGVPNVVKPWSSIQDPLIKSVVRVRALYEFCAKMGIPYQCYHDGDYVDLTLPIKKAEAQFSFIADVMEALQNQTGVKTGWGTNQLFAIPLYRQGAATSPYMPAFVRAARQAKLSIDTVVRLGAKRFVFWGGREGYCDITSAKTKFEKDNLAQFLWMCVKYADEKGFFDNGGKFLIEPKGKEPTEHQYDADVETCVAFLKEYGLYDYFEFNVEVNHAYLAGKTAEHEFRAANDRGKLGGIDANQGRKFTGWDLDMHADPEAGIAVGQAVYDGKGLHGGVINHDAKIQGVFSPEYPRSLAEAVIAAQDNCALGLWLAHFIAVDGRIPRMIENRYSSWKGPDAEEIISGNATLQSLSSVAEKMEKRHLFDAAKVPSLDAETMARIRGEIQFDLVRRIEEELVKQGI